MGTRKLVFEIYKPGQPNSVRTTELHPNTIDSAVDMSQLDANTVYGWHVWAQDINGHAQLQSGTVRTLHRHVEVNFQKIDVIDDSDDLSGGDLTFWFNANGKWNEDNMYGEVTVDTGDSAWPNHVETVHDAPNSILVGTYGHDDDCGPFTLCVEALGPSFTGGSDDEGDWASASMNLNLNIPGPNESFVAVTDFQTTQWSLKFKVTVQYTVSYTFA